MPVKEKALKVGVISVPLMHVTLSARSKLSRFWENDYRIPIRHEIIGKVREKLFRRIRKKINSKYGGRVKLKDLGSLDLRNYPYTKYRDTENYFSEYGCLYSSAPNNLEQLKKAGEELREKTKDFDLMIVLSQSHAGAFPAYYLHEKGKNIIRADAHGDADTKRVNDDVVDYMNHVRHAIKHGLIEEEDIINVGHIYGSICGKKAEPNEVEGEASIADIDLDCLSGKKYRQYIQDHETSNLTLKNVATILKKTCPKVVVLSEFEQRAMTALLKKEIGKERKETRARHRRFIKSGFKPMTVIEPIAEQRGKVKERNALFARNLKIMQRIAEAAIRAHLYKMRKNR
ncbi:hypothetical protein HZC09_06790 [Candidatus Micrarchaeota archaeon]|nr:hypothetical protein [Candidatus Micrarchaeota archaeon]